MGLLSDCVVSRGHFRGWRAAFLCNGLVTLAAVPDIGGRIMAYDLGDYPYLFVDPGLAGKLFSAAENQGDGSLAAWKNYGGDKTWPAPQGWDGPDQWPGPPDPILDTGRYQLAELASTRKAARTSMLSPAGSPTGVRITRSASIRSGSSRVHLRLNFSNVSDRPVRWSIWDVVQLRADRWAPDGSPGPDDRLRYEPGCVVTAPLNPGSRFPAGYNVMFGDPDNSQWQADPETGLFTARYGFEIGKVGLDSHGGWIAFANTTSGYAFAERFTVEPGGEYPDAGSTVECWTVGRGQVETLSYDEATGPFLMETEVLSPFRHIPPGASAGFAIEWGACRCAGPVVDVSLAGCVSEPLRAERADGRLHFMGAFGVFDVGEMELLWLNDEASESVEVAQPQRLGAVNPLELVRLDHTFPIPAQAGRARLVVVSATGEAHTLAETSLNA